MAQLIVLIDLRPMLQKYSLIIDRTRLIIRRYSAVIKIAHGVSYQGKRLIQEGRRVVKQDGLLRVSLTASTAGTQRKLPFTKELDGLGQGVFWTQNTGWNV